MPTALIVDDEPQANTLLSMLVQLRGYRTVSALTGREAISAVEREPFDVVFLDLMLPDVNGYEVCRHIKNRSETSLTPIVMVTARVATENRSQSYLQGADNYVAKPYTPDQIFEALDEAAQHLKDVAAGGGGTVTFSVRDDSETLQKLSRLRSLVVARTPFSPDDARRFGQALCSLWESADAWGRENRVGEVARLRAETFDDRLEITLSDLSGWLAGAAGLSTKWFDRVDLDGPTGVLTLTKRFDLGG